MNNLPTRPGTVVRRTQYGNDLWMIAENTEGKLVVVGCYAPELPGDYDAMNESGAFNDAEVVFSPPPPLI